MKPMNSTKKVQRDPLVVPKRSYNSKINRSFNQLSNVHLIGLLNSEKKT